MSEFSLLDTVGMKTTEWWLAYHDQVAHFRFMEWLKPGFRHVELTRSVRYGPALSDVLWLSVLPTVEMLDAEIGFDPKPPWVRCPGSTFQRVRAAHPVGSMRQWWHFGPLSCVEIAKMALGINAFFVRTPWQLYQYIQRRDGAITSR